MNNALPHTLALIGTDSAAILNFRGTLIQRLVNDGHNVYVFASNYDPASKEQIRCLGAIPIDNPVNRSSLNPFADLIGCFKLAGILRTLKPTCVFSFFVKPVIFGSIAAKLSGNFIGNLSAKLSRVSSENSTKNSFTPPRILAMLEGLGYFFTKRPDPDSFKTRLVRSIQVCLYRVSFLCIDQLILLNTDDNKDLIERYKLKVRDLKILGGIGVDLEKFKPAQPHHTPITFLFVGRLLFDKGIREFIAAAYIVKQAYPTALFKIVGDCDLQNPASLSEKDKTDLRDKGIITVVGFDANVAGHLDAASVLVLPSYREGVPLVVQEAMAMARPIITTDVPGCRDTIEDGVSGYVVPPFDAKRLAEKMILFCETPEQIDLMGKKARARANLLFNRIDKDKTLLEWLLIRN